MAEGKTITVQGSGDDNRVVLWEKDARHPQGEVMVVNNGKPVTVTETAAVKRLVGEGRLTTQVSQDSQVAFTVQDGSSLRPASEEEKDAAGLTGEVERQTAVTEDKNQRRK